MSQPARRVHQLAPFDESFPTARAPFVAIGSGQIGGKASGLLKAIAIVSDNPFEAAGDRLRIAVSRSVVITTELFDAFMAQNDLYEIALSGAPDGEIAQAFQMGELPEAYVEDLRTLVTVTAGRPLAVRSSSLLEDSLEHPFAGIYQTKMIPNNQESEDDRFRTLAQALKYVYASVYSRAAMAYIRAVGEDPRAEKMAVLVHEVIGHDFGDRFYPEVSGVCRSFSYYRTGSARPDEGAVTLALGLGKTIMDGGVSYSYSPAHPKARPPYASVRDLLKRTQLKFWAVDMTGTGGPDPTSETEFLVEGDLDAADRDRSLSEVASTYDVLNDRLTPGTGNYGPRVIDFAPMVRLERWPVTAACRHLLDLFRRELGYAVEVEFAVTFEGDLPRSARLHVLQVRPMATPGARIKVKRPAPDAENVVLYSDRVMGNGAYTDLEDIIYVAPGRFDRSVTREIAREIEQLNERMRQIGKRYLLIGFGRWGSSDPWLGIPASWGQISEASVIVESTLPDLDVEPSQGSHFFLNIESFRVAYFTVPHGSRPPTDWDWIRSLPVVEETEHVTHVRTYRPLRIMVDGRTGRGVVRRASDGNDDTPGLPL